MRAEAEVYRGSFIADATPRAGLTQQPDLLPRPACLHRERTARTLLARKAMTDRNPEWIALRGDAKPAARARSGARVHEERLS